jgi:spore maturation protein CgeB
MMRLLKELHAARRPGASRPRIALVSDALTQSSLEAECDVITVTPRNHKFTLKYGRPDLLLVESAWQGHANKWKFRIAAYPDHPQRSNVALAELVARARDAGIPTVFWNKEDGVHFDRFIDSARLFDHVFTVDENCIARYRAVVAPEVTVDTLLFAVQPDTHSFSGFDFKYKRSNFVGSYSHHIHNRRRCWQDMFFSVASETGLGVTAVDRNSGRKAAHYRYPQLPNFEVLPAVTHAQTAQIYKDYLVSLNVNTIEDSATMFSRRLVEILACGGIAVTNPSPAVTRYFQDYCHVLHTADEAHDLFDRLRHGPDAQDLELARAGAEYVLREHTWAHRLDEIMAVTGRR